MDLTNNPLDGVSVELVGDQLTNWNVTIQGPVILNLFFWQINHTFHYSKIPPTTVEDSLWMLTSVTTTPSSVPRYYFPVIEANFLLPIGSFQDQDLPPQHQAGYWRDLHSSHWEQLGAHIECQVCDWECDDIAEES